MFLKLAVLSEGADMAGIAARTSSPGRGHPVATPISSRPTQSAQRGAHE
jgi:hypothetical protein